MVKLDKILKKVVKMKLQIITYSSTILSFFSSLASVLRALLTASKVRGGLFQTEFVVGVGGSDINKFIFLARRRVVLCVLVGRLAKNCAKCILATTEMGAFFCLPLLGNLPKLRRVQSL